MSWEIGKFVLFTKIEYFLDEYIQGCLDKRVQPNSLWQLDEHLQGYDVERDNAFEVSWTLQSGMSISLWSFVQFSCLGWLLKILAVFVSSQHCFVAKSAEYSFEVMKKNKAQVVCDDDMRYKKVQSFRNYNCPTVQEGMFFNHSEDELCLTVRSSFRVAIKVMSS